MTIHVDYILACANSVWLEWARTKLEARFGKVKRQQLPFTHCGLLYSRLGDGGMSLDQEAYVKAMQPITIPKERLVDHTSPLDKFEHKSFRSLVCAMLWTLQTRLDRAADITILQQHIQSPTIGDSIAANKLLKQLQSNASEIKLYDRPFSGPYRILAVSDASHATKLTSYAQGPVLFAVS